MKIGAIKTYFTAFLVIVSLTSGCNNPSIPSTLLSSTTTFQITSIPTESTTTPSASLPLYVYFINVGQGDSILIDQGENEILIDGGVRQSGITQFLKQLVQGDLEVIIATHPHSDHIGGLIDVLNNFKVDQVWYNGEQSTTQTYKDFMTAIQTNNSRAYVGNRGQTITAGSITLTILNPFDLLGTTNNNSIVTELDYGKVDFLFEGDTEQVSEARMLNASNLALHHIKILKVGHHGSRTASSLAFLSLLKPEVAIYSAGVNNQYGHPHAETLSRLNNIGANIYGTDKNGTIVVITDGINFNVQPQYVAN